MIIKALKTKNYYFYTYSLNEDKPLRMVLRNLHWSTDMTDIKNAIEENDFQVIRITNILKNNTKQPLPPFYVDIKTSENSYKIFELNKLLNTVVIFEEPGKYRELIQCKRCQLCNHSANYCNLPSRCVKCAGRHDTSLCKKTMEEPAKCALYEGNHPASYRGCPFYQQQLNFYNKSDNADPNHAINNIRSLNHKQIYAQSINNNQTYANAAESHAIKTNANITSLHQETNTQY